MAGFKARYLAEQEQFFIEKSLMAPEFLAKPAVKLQARMLAGKPNVFTSYPKTRRARLAVVGRDKVVNAAHKAVANPTGVLEQVGKGSGTVERGVPVQRKVDHKGRSLPWQLHGQDTNPRRDRTPTKLVRTSPALLDAFYKTPAGKKALKTHQLGKPGTLSWGPTDGKNNKTWRRRSGFGQDRPKNRTGYQGSGRPYGVAKRNWGDLDAPKRPLTAREKANGLTPDMIMTNRDYRRQVRTTQAGIAGVALVGGYGAAKTGNAIGTRLRHAKMARMAQAAHVLKSQPPLKTTITPEDAKHQIERHGLKGPLPKGLTREQKMAAYEARYVSAGGHKAAKWQNRANGAEKARVGGVAAGTAAGGAWLASHGKGRVLGRVNRALPHLRHHSELGLGVAGTTAGATELYGTHARKKRTSYASAPSGVAASALRRMRAYTPSEAR